MAGWIGVDLDGTLAEYDSWRGVTYIGTPIPAMVRRVKDWIEQGARVKIVTARVSSKNNMTVVATATLAIQRWCCEHIGTPLEVTAEKDFEMLVLYDDRCVQVELNTGRLIGVPQ
jgi:hypothetical protein